MSLNKSGMLLILAALIAAFFGGGVDAWCVHRQGSPHGLNPPSCVVPFEQLGDSLFTELRPLEGDILPSWYNETLYKKAQAFASKHHFASYLAPMAGMGMFTNNPLIKDLLQATGKTLNPYTSNKRYLATMLHMRLWYEGSGDKNNGIDDNIIESLNRVRGVHFALVRNFTVRSVTQKARSNVLWNDPAIAYDKGMWDAIAKDLAASNVPYKYRDWPDAIKNRPRDGDYPLMNQLAFAITQHFLGGIQPIIPKKLGIHQYTEEEWTAWNHMWAVIGYAIGMDDKYNIHLQPNNQAARVYFVKMYDAYTLSSWFQMTPDGAALTEAFFTGFVRTFLGDNAIADNLISAEQFHLLLLEDTLGFKMTNLRARLGPVEGVVRFPLSRLTSNLFKSDFVRGSLNSVVKAMYFGRGGKRILGFDTTDPQKVAEESFVYEGYGRK